MRYFDTVGGNSLGFPVRLSGLVNGRLLSLQRWLAWYQPLSRNVDSLNRSVDFRQFSLGDFLQSDTFVAR
jgi:hypothetical protein